MASYGLMMSGQKLRHCLFLTMTNHLMMSSGLTQVVITNNGGDMANTFYVAKLLRNEQQQAVAEIQTDHARFSVVYEYESDLRENGLNIWVGLSSVSIMVVDDIRIDLVLSSIDKYIQRELSQSIVRELLK
jgi:hypothetical protein